MATEAEEEVRVLFVEDDAAVAEMYRLKLELDGYTVTIAPAGEQGLKMAKESPPDILFLDIRLPQMAGSSVLQYLRAAARPRPGAARARPRKPEVARATRVGRGAAASSRERSRHAPGRRKRAAR